MSAQIPEDLAVELHPIIRSYDPVAAEACRLLNVAYSVDIQPFSIVGSPEMHHAHTDDTMLILTAAGGGQVSIKNAKLSRDADGIVTIRFKPA